MEGPGQRESLNKMLLLQQTVYTLDTDRDEEGHWSGAKQVVVGQLMTKILLDYINVFLSVSSLLQI